MNQNMSSYDQASAQPLSFGEAMWQLPLQYIKVLSKPSVNTLREEMGKASWGMVLVQFLSLVILTVSIGSVKPLALLPSPLNGITLVLASFFIGLGTAYLFSKLSGGQGTFLAHIYCLLVCTVPLVTVSGALLLIPATGWLVLLLGSVVSALFIYRMVLHTYTIMAVHRLGAGQATTIVLILPMLILVVIMLAGMVFWTEGDVLFSVFDVFPWVGERRQTTESARREAETHPARATGELSR
jgi:hypothetical protein